MNVGDRTRCAALTLAALVSVESRAQVIFTEGFQGPLQADCIQQQGAFFPEGWIAIDVDGSFPRVERSGSWIVEPIRSDYCAATSTSAYSPPASANDFLCTPSIQLPEKSQLHWTVRSTDPFRLESYEVRAMRSMPIGSEGNEGNLVSDSAVLFAGTAGYASTWSGDAQSVRLDLAGFASESIHICFRHVTTDGDNLELRRVEVERLTDYDAAVIGGDSYQRFPAMYPGLGFSLRSIIENRGLLPITEVDADVVLRLNEEALPVDDPPSVAVLQPGERSEYETGVLGAVPPTGVLTMTTSVSTSEGDDEPANSEEVTRRVIELTDDEFACWYGDRVDSLPLHAGDQLWRMDRLGTMGLDVRLRGFRIGVDTSLTPSESTGSFAGSIVSAAIVSYDTREIIAGGEAVVPGGSSGIVTVDIPLGDLVVERDVLWEVVLQGETFDGSPIRLVRHEFDCGTDVIRLPSGDLFSPVALGYGRGHIRVSHILADLVVVARDDRAGTPEDQAIDGGVASNDLASGEPGDIWSVIRQPRHGTLDMSPNGTFTYVPERDYHGADDFDYRLCSASGICDPARAEMSIQSDNVSVGDDYFRVASGATLMANVTGNDDDHLGEWRLLGAPASGSLSFDATGDFTFVPATDGEAEFFYEGCWLEHCDRARVVISSGSDIFSDSFE